LETIRARRVEDGVELGVSIPQEGLDSCVVRLKLGNLCCETAVEVKDDGFFSGLGRSCLSKHQWRAVDWRYISPEEVSCTSVVQFLDKSKFSIEESVRERSTISRIRIAISDIINANPNRKQRVRARPRCRRRLASNRAQEFIHLIRHRQYRRLIRRNEVGVDRRSTVSVVVCVDEGLVVGGREVSDPVRASRGTIAGERRVADRVGVVRESAGDIETGLGV